VAVPADFLGGRDDLMPMFSRSDFVVVSCPLNAETKGWIGKEELSALPSHSVLINVARAEIIQERPLFEALQSRQIAAAALDVWYRYPAVGAHIMHGSELPFHELPNVIVTPHLSAWTSALVERRLRGMAENLDRLYRGEPLERVLLTGSWKP